MDEYADLKEAPSSARATSVSDVMNTNPLVVAVKTTVEEAARSMKEAGVHEMPVLRAGVLVGILSALDVLDLISGEPGSRADHPSRRSG